MKASWACLILLSTVLPILAAEYEVDGNIEQTLFKQDGSVQSVATSTFTVYVTDCSWLIRNTNFDQAGHSLTVNETAFTNNALIYSVSRKADRNQTSSRRLSPNFVNVYSNNVPVGTTDNYFICHLWLMFASGCYFQNLSTNWLTPAYDLNASAAVHPDLKREATWELINGPGSLPSKVAYFRNPDTIDATYTSTGMTNVGELKIPSGFIFELRVGGGFSTRFALGQVMPGESDPTYRIRKRAVATVTAVRPVCTRSELMPVESGYTMVVDRRLASATSTSNVLYYRNRGGVQWLPVEEAKKVAAAQKAPTPFSPEAAAKRSKWVISLMCIFLAVPPIIYFSWRRFKKY